MPRLIGRETVAAAAQAECERRYGRLPEGVGITPTQLAAALNEKEE